MEIGNLIGTEFFENGKTLKVIDAKIEGENITLITVEVKETDNGKENTDKKNKKVCIIIGHGGSDPGAVSQDKKTTELAYNTEIAEKLSEELKENGYEAFTHNRGYSKMENTQHINSQNPDLVISLHCNSSGPHSTGTEAIHYPDSKNGVRFATILSKNVSEAFGIRNRGAKEPYQGRGDGLLRRLKAPAVISEPFFISNNEDLKLGLEKKDEYIQAIVKSIDEYFA